MTDDQRWVGPSERAAQRVRALRARRGWSAARLAAECAQLGMPELNRTAIANIESRRRKQVTLDEAVVLAVALGVNVNTLLLPPDGAVPPMAPVQITPTVAAHNWWRAWGWATGDAPLDAPDSSRLRLSELAEWFEATRPHKTPEEITAEMSAAQRARLTRQSAEVYDNEVEDKEARERWRAQQDDG